MPNAHHHFLTRSQLLVALLGSAVIVLLMILPGIPKSYAHASFVNSEPSPFQSLSSQPSRVVVQFSEPIDMRYSKVIVLDESGRQVDNKDVQYFGSDETMLSVTLPSGLEDGVYTVNTRVLSAVDGHVTEDAFLFATGEAEIPQASPLTTVAKSVLFIPDSIARFPTLVGQVMVVGSAFATLWLWRPISKISWLKESISHTRAKIDLKFMNMAIIGSAILVASDFAMFYVQAISIDASFVDVIDTKFGNVLLIRTLLSFVLLVLVLYVRSGFKKSIKTHKEIPRGFLTALFAVGLVVLATTSLIGHGAAKAQLLPISIDFIHNLAAAVWIGGISFLAFVIVPTLKDDTALDDRAKVSVISILIPRFSTVVVSILGIIAVTGPTLLYILESNLGLTLASVYGQALIVKLALAAVMIGFGTYNQFVVHKHALKVTLFASTSPSGNRGPSEPNGISSLTENSKRVLSKFNKSVKAESIVGMALLAAVAVLVNTALPSNQFQNQIQQQNTASIASGQQSGATDQGLTSTRFVENGSRVVLSIDPFIVGNNNFKISLKDSNNDPLDIKSVQMKLTQIDKGIGPIRVDAKQTSKGMFDAQAAFGLSGRWSVLVQAEQYKANAPSIVATYDLLVKPKLNQQAFSVQEFKTPDNKSLPLYPVYDSSRNVIWIGDTASDSGRILAFDLNSSKFAEHKINDAKIITVLALDASNKLWYTDPLSKTLGSYDPQNRTAQKFQLPSQAVPGALAIDTGANSIWLASPTTNEILKFDIQSGNFAALKLPTENGNPIGITVDKERGQIWVAEAVGKIAKIDPAEDYKITEYSPSGKNNSLIDPAALLVDPVTGGVYISEHEGHAVSVFNPILKTFRQHKLNPEGLPFGLALDGYGNLWVAEHTVNKIAVLDPRTGANKEVTIPTQSPFTQWLTSDSRGNIWFAEQRGHSIGSVTITAKPAPASQIGGGINQTGGNVFATGQSDVLGVGIGYPQLVTPFVTIGIIASAFFYSKSLIDQRRSINNVRNMKQSNSAGDKKQ